MTDNCDELRSAIREIWPSARLLLCIFHILQQVRRWLYDKHHGVNKYDRVEIMKLFRKLVHADTVTSFEVAAQEMMEAEVLTKYLNAGVYFQDLVELKENWATCFRTDLMTRGTNTNNYVEAQFLVIKDTILKRQRQYNVNMILDKLLTDTISS